MSQLVLPFSQITPNVTPMMKQYLDIKSQYPDAIVFYRMGDFYEMFFDDALKAAPILGIALTKRGQNAGEDIPMCGVPFHSSDAYIAKLIEKDHKVVICEQMETPEEAKKRGYKAVVRRDVVRIITPGTLTEENLLNNRSSNFLTAIGSFKEELAISWCDISTGEFYFSSSSVETLANDLARINPKEILINDKLYQQDTVNLALVDYRRLVTIQANNLFDAKRAENKINSYYQIFTSNSLGNFTPAELICCGAILEYIELTQKTNQSKVAYPKKLNQHSFMAIDAASRKNLELVCTTSGEKKGSLLNLIDQTKTSSGSRLLAQFLSAPLVDVEAINKRLDLVEFFINNASIIETLNAILTIFGDVERALARLNFNRSGPRDLHVIKTSLLAANHLLSFFSSFANPIPKELDILLSNLLGFDQLYLELENALKDELPFLARDGGFIKEAYDQKLDELQNLKNDSKTSLNQLKSKYIQITGVNSLKINYNNVLGYFIDVSPQHASKMKDEIFIHRQTLANSIRYTSVELRELEKTLLNLEDNIIKLELELYSNLVKQVMAKADHLNLFAYSVAKIDVAINLAALAKQNNYCRPQIDNSYDFDIVSARHPIIENALNKQGVEFVANDCSFKQDSNLWLITGPNMAGKSTFLRQNAILVILAQIGSFVPATKAYFGIVDKIFCRVGAADDLARGRSTFMVEMVETANILNNATARSLIILDEIGRGTSTYDGVSIASACLEYIHDHIQARALFATHYHELTSLKDQLQKLSCYTMQIKEWQDKIIFMHKIIPGSADKSYGIHVASLAGLPKIVIHKAQSILKNLESVHNDALDIDLSAATEISNHPIIEQIKNLNIDDLTPKAALEILYQLKKQT
jgi:DNA mismatch repair protein MutS